MRFGIHHSSWLDGPGPAEAFEAVKAKAEWAEHHGFVWFSVMDHMIQIPRVGPPDAPILEGWTVLAALAAVTSRIRLATLCTVGYRNWRIRQDRGERRSDQPGRLTLGIGAGFFEDEYRQYGWSSAGWRRASGRWAIQLILKMDRAADDLPRPVFPCRGCDPRAEAGAKAASAGDDRRRRRADDATRIARLADACNFVDGDIAEIRHKLAVLRGHCDAVGRDYDTIEKTRIQPWLLARDDAAVAAKRERLAAASGPLRGFVGTASEAIDLVGQHQDAGIELLISADRRNDVESRELFASDVMPHFA
jgi:alkanesulfonate monooxygenase SsuD/methylene tetrahydromethanopterin reductase-like flavin-dependent oxidoreductase (luciferase family)